MGDLLRILPRPRRPSLGDYPQPRAEALASSDRQLGVALISSLAELQSAVSGRVIASDAADYETVRRPPPARYDSGFLDRLERLQPRVIVRCRSAEDVVATVAYARRNHLKVAVRSGGHCFAGSSSTDAVLIDLSPMSSVMISGDRARVGAGTLLGDLYDQLQERGRTLPAGSHLTVGIGGLTLGGGIGLLGRKHGLTCDQLLGARVVLADGSIVDCDREHNVDLFWALRGAGREQVGVVTSLLFRTLPTVMATAFRMTWDYRRAATFLDCWQRWAPDSPDELTASLLITVAAEREEAPQVHLIGAALLHEGEALSHLQELISKVGVEPKTVHIAYGFYRQAMSLLDEAADQLGGGDGTSSKLVPALSRSDFFRRELPADSINSLLLNLVSERTPGQAREIDCMPWGGAYNRLPINATAFPHRRERYLIKHTVVLAPQPSERQKDRAQHWLLRSWQSTHPFGSGGVYANFPDLSLPDPGRSYYAQNLDRLRAIKDRYDPDGTFLSPSGLERSLSATP